MQFKSLLPRNRTPVELQLEQALAVKYCVEKLDPDVIRKLHNPAECPADFLAWLAYSLSVDVWDDNWDEAKKRRVIAASVDIHRHKGTVGAVKRTLDALGVENYKVIEWFQRPEQLEKGRFFVEIPPDDSGIDSAIKQAQVISAIDSVKKLSAHYTLLSHLACESSISNVVNHVTVLHDKSTVNYSDSAQILVASALPSLGQFAQINTAESVLKTACYNATPVLSCNQALTKNPELILKVVSRKLYEYLPDISVDALFNSIESTAVGGLIRDVRAIEKINYAVNVAFESKTAIAVASKAIQTSPLKTAFDAVIRSDCPILISNQTLPKNPALILSIASRKPWEYLPDIADNAVCEDKVQVGGFAVAYGGEKYSAFETSVTTDSPLFAINQSLHKPPELIINLVGRKNTETAVNQSINMAVNAQASVGFLSVIYDVEAAKKALTDSATLIVCKPLPVFVHNQSPYKTQPELLVKLATRAADVTANAAVSTYTALGVGGQIVDNWTLSSFTANAQNTVAGFTAVNNINQSEFIAPLSVIAYSDCPIFTSNLARYQAPPESALKIASRKLYQKVNADGVATISTTVDCLAVVSNSNTEILATTSSFNALPFFAQNISYKRPDKPIPNNSTQSIEQKLTDRAILYSVFDPMNEGTVLRAIS